MKRSGLSAAQKADSLAAHQSQHHLHFCLEKKWPAPFSILHEHLRHEGALCPKSVSKEIVGRGSAQLSTSPMLVHIHVLFRGRFQVPSATGE